MDEFIAALFLKPTPPPLTEAERRASDLRFAQSRLKAIFESAAEHLQWVSRHDWGPVALSEADHWALRWLVAVETDWALRDGAPDAASATSLWPIDRHADEVTWSDWLGQVAQAAAARDLEHRRLGDDYSAEGVMRAHRIPRPAGHQLEQLLVRRLADASATSWQSLRINGGRVVLVPSAQHGLYIDLLVDGAHARIVLTPTQFTRFRAIVAVMRAIQLSTGVEESVRQQLTAFCGEALARVVENYAHTRENLLDELASQLSGGHLLNERVEGDEISTLLVAAELGLEAGRIRPALGS